MGKLLSPSFWLSTLISTFITMLMIYAIKTVANKYNVPVVKDVANGI